MAYIRANSGSGSDLSETTLWTNSSPTTGISLGTLLNLSQSMTNFKYLRFYWRYSVTNEGTIRSVIIAVSDMKNCTDAAFAPRLVLGGWNANSKMNFARCIKYNNDTSVYCYNGVKCWGSGTMEANAGWIIPTKITGMN